MKALLIAVSLLALGACAKSAPPPMEIPLGLLNYNPQVVIAPERPDASGVLAIEADDTPESALDTLIQYLSNVGLYTIALEDQQAELQKQKAIFMMNQTKIKQVILMTQP